MRCPLCPHHCLLAQQGALGRCRARIRRGDSILPLHGQLLSALALDPIEKKPLHRFFPGSRILSVGGFGCNMRCYFCQNADIACAYPEEAEGRLMPPEELVELAQRLKPEGNIGLAFTYNEPLVNPEYVVACSQLLKQAGMQSVVVTNGCFDTAPMEALFSLVDAWNIDLKGFTEPWYRRLGGDLATVKAFIQRASQSAHVELSCLVVPGENDSPEEMDALSAWVAGVDPGIPLHLSRYFPRHRATAAPTPTATLHRLREVALRHLDCVLLGNV